MPAYTKPACTPAALLTQWQARGLYLPDLPRAERYLTHISYYRFSAYAIPFQQLNDPRHHFKPNTSFDDILTLYVFDRELRLLILDALERIEIAVRTHLCNHMSLTYSNPFWYMEQRHFKRDYQHARLLDTIQKQLSDEQKRMQRDENLIINKRHLSTAQQQQMLDQVRKENFLRHYLSQHYQPHLPPCWMMVEMLTWGDLSFLYHGLLSNADQKAIARALGTHAELLTSWLKVLNDVRNICAHHGRLWNKEFGRSVKIPKSHSHPNAKKWLANPVTLASQQIRFEKRIYAVLVVIQSLMYTICPHSSWALRLQKLLHQYSSVNGSSMGIPQAWSEDPFWHPALQNTP